MVLSNSAEAPAICIIVRPAGAAVSIASVKLRNSTSAPQSFHDDQNVPERTREPVDLQTTSTSPPAEMVEKSLELVDPSAPRAAFTEPRSIDELNAVLFS